MKSVTMRDKRRQKRFIKRCEIEFISGGVTYRGISSNFSLNGLFIRTSYPFAAGTIFDIVIHLPDGSNSKVKVRVARAVRTEIGKMMGASTKVFKNGMGVEIVEKDANYLHFIRSLLI